MTTKMFELTDVHINFISFLTGLGILICLVKFHYLKQTRCVFTQTENVCCQNRQINFASTQTENVIRKNTGTQTIQKEAKTVQTETMKFTERITNFDTEQVNSSEIFDNCCEICVANVEKEAVGYCKVCETFMCLNCCKHHEKIPLSKSHTLLSRENYQNAKEKIPKVKNHLVPVQIYGFKECVAKMCVPEPNPYCMADHFIQAFGLANILTSGEICCILHRYSRGSKLSWEYEDDTTGIRYNSDILQDHLAANDFCTTNLKTYESPKGESKNTIYFTIPKATTVWRYEHKKYKATSNTYDTCKSIKGFTTEAFYKNGQCYGIAAFDNGLAVSIFIPTKYTLPDWQVQYVTFTGMVKQQIYYDNEGKPLLKDPKYLTSNDAQNVLFISNQGTNTIIALDPKGTVLFKFTHETIKCPRGLTCDDEGNIYVACKSKIIQINKLGTKSRIILSSSEKEQNMLIDVCYNKVSQKLAVVSKYSKVTVFKFIP